MSAASKDRQRLYRTLAGWPAGILVGAVVTGFVLVLYLGTLAPTVLPYGRPTLLDSAMLQAQVATLGMTHPTGYPTYLMLTHLFTYLPFGDVAYRVNLASAVYGALAVLVLYAVAFLLTRWVLAAAVGALAFGVGTTFWSTAVIAEVYTMNIVFIGLVLLSLLLWRETRRDRYLLLACFLLGLTLTHHLTSGLLLPAALLFVGAVEWRKLVEWRLVLKGVALFFAGLLPYLYLPVRGSMNPPMNEADPTTPERFWAMVTGGDLTDDFAAFGLGQLPGRVMLFGGYLLDNLPWALAVLAVVGALSLARPERLPEMLMLGFLFVGWLAYAVNYQIFDYFLYFIPVYAILVLYVALGLGVLLDAFGDALRGLPAAVRVGAPALLALLFALLPLSEVSATAERVDRSEDYRGRETIEAVAEGAAPNSTVLHHRSELWYMVLVEERRQDLTLVSPWYPAWQRHTDLVWPDDIDHVTSNLRYGTHDYTGVAAAREAAERGSPVYILDQESAQPQNFYDAGFGTRRVEGRLYELVPPQER